MISHHSSTSSSSKYLNPQEQVSEQTPSVNRTSKLEVSTSISNLDNVLIDLNAHSENSKYKETLKQVILEWSNDIPRIDEKFENVKQNALNELIEDVYKIFKHTEYTADDLNLSREIDEFFNTIPHKVDDELTMKNLKQNLIRKLIDFNKKYRNTESKNNIDNNRTRDDLINSINNDRKESRELNVVYSNASVQTSFDEFITFNSSINNKKSFVGNQIQSTLKDVFPLYESIYKDAILQAGEPDRTEKTETIKQKIFDWIMKLNNRGFVDLNNYNVHKLVKELYDQLNPILQCDLSTFDGRIVLRQKIVHFITKTLIKPLSGTDLEYFNGSVDILTIDMLKDNIYALPGRSIYIPNRKHIYSSACNGMSINEFVSNTLAYNEIYSERLIDNITECILQYLDSNTTYRNQNLKVRVANLFKYTGLSQNEVDAIINNIVEHINKMSNKTDTKDIADAPWRNIVMPVYKSECDLTGQSNNSNVSNKQKPCKSKKKNNKLKPDEINYMNAISAATMKWLEDLPVSDKLKNKKVKNSFVQNLSEDILDQLMLNHLIEETSENNKYIAFFIYRCLKNFELFENLDETKPYVDELLKQITNIPLPTIYQHSKKELASATTKELDGKDISEIILKNYISKYLEHRYDPEDSIAKEAFSRLLKNELNKLSTPKSGSTVSDNQKDIILKLSKELEYIEAIADWMNTLPLLESFYKIDRNILAKLVNDLSKDLHEIENDLSTSANEVEHDKCLAEVIKKLIEQLPVSQHERKNINSMIDKLITKIKDLRTNFTLNELNDTQTHDISNFIEEYIRNNSYEISDDDLKLEACILRFFQEIDKKELESVQSVHKSKGEWNGEEAKTVNGNKTSRRFSFELGYANEISQWLHNLPLQPLYDKQTQSKIANMVSALAEKICIELMEEKDFSHIDNNFIDFISDWIRALPLNPNREINLPVAIKQLLNRLERVNVEKYKPYGSADVDKSDILISKANVNNNTQCHECCDKDLSVTTIIDEVEKWCFNLPIQSENDNINDNITLKQNAATKLYRTIRQLNMTPEYFTNNLLYQEFLSEEIERVLDDLNPRLQVPKEVLKTQLLNTVLEKRNEIKNKMVALEYKHDLKKTIEMSVPYSLSNYVNDNPQFELVKDRLASIFLLDNFDHSNDAVKSKYENSLKEHVDNHFEDIIRRNSISLNKDEIYNDIYSTLFTVPAPKEYFLTEEVEEIKTKCEIDTWFDSLPLREANGFGELLEWNQILTTLTQRLHNIEKYEHGHASKMLGEICKWLLRLPLLPGHENNLEAFARDLQSRLKVAGENRKCLQRETIENLPPNNNNTKGVVNNTSASINNESMWNNARPSALPACCRTPAPNVFKKPTDAIIDIVETWCQNIKLQDTLNHEGTPKTENIAIKIMKKITEMHMNPEIFADDILYEGILDDELDNLLANLPLDPKFNNHDAKCQLINAIKSIRPLIKEEKLRYEYKLEIKNAIETVLSTPNVGNSEKNDALASIRDDIADNFILYEFQKEGDEKFKIKNDIQRKVETYLLLITDETDAAQIDPYIKTNQLLCQLRKTCTPKESTMMEELQEIQMKLEIANFFNEVFQSHDINKQFMNNQVKASLAKRLTEFEKMGYTDEHIAKMKTEVVKYLKKINDNVHIQEVEAFIDTLNKTHMKRMPNYKLSSKDGSLAQTNEGITNGNEQWLSLLSATPNNRNIHKNEGQAITSFNNSRHNHTLKNVSTKSSSTRIQSEERQQIGNRQRSYQYSPNNRVPCGTKEMYQGFQSPHLYNSNEHISDISHKQIQETSDLIGNKNIDYTHFQSTPQSVSDNGRSYDNQMRRSGPQCNRNNMASLQQSPQMDSFTNETQTQPNKNSSLYQDIDLVSPSKTQQSQIGLPTSCRDIQGLKSCISPSERPVLSSNTRRSCRRPSITIFSPSYLEPKIDDIQEKNESSAEVSKMVISDEEKIPCSCRKKALRSKKISCSANKRKYCKFCDRFHPFICGYRYPNCYY